VTSTEEPPRPRPLWPLLVAAGVVIVLVVVASAFVPRWWAHRVGDFSNQSFTRGILAGLVLGFVCTLLPLAA
jgi:ABC-type multidrug transport system fused ATPase/permease subunit